jgi:hypothetical protein
MPLWLQHLLVLLLVGGCVAIVLRNALRTLLGKKSRVGNCCAKGCTPESSDSAGDRKVHFLPVEMLRRRR